MLVLEASEARVTARRRRRRRRQRGMLWLLTGATTAVLVVIAAFIMHISKVPDGPARRAVRLGADGQPPERLRAAHRVKPCPHSTGTR